MASWILRVFKRPDCQEGKKLCRSPAILREMFSKPVGDDRLAVCELPLLDLGKASANVFRKGAIDGNADHALGGVSETLEIGPGRRPDNRLSCRC